MPAATPQTATRRTRSGSPPNRFQRTDVNQMQATIASSSIRPYMWIGRPKMWKTPVCGDEIEASSRVTGATFCRPGRQPGRVANRIAGPLELLGAPLLDPVELGVQAELSFRRSHTYRFGGRG